MVRRKRMLPRIGTQFKGKFIAPEYFAEVIEESHLKEAGAFSMQAGSSVQ